MSTRFLNFWTKLHSTFWFVPTLMVVGALLLSFGMIAVDEATDASVSSRLSWIYTNKPEGARAVLSTIAGSMITVAGVVFSITIVALSLASSQFGPRLLGSFMRDTGNQVVLGIFISTFFYCLLILRTIRSGDETSFVPHLSVAVGVLLAICSLAVLIYFIHHVSESIQVSTIISRVDLDLSKVVDRLFPERLGEGGAPVEMDTAALLQDRICQPVCTSRAGYVQAIDQDSLLKICTQQDLVVRLLASPGDYAVAEQQVAEVFRHKPCPGNELKKIARCFLLGKERTLEHDMLFPVNQLVEIALRALSPSVNDPFTASACLNRLTNGLCDLAGRSYPSPYRLDDEEHLRVIVVPVTFPQALHTALDQFRLYAKANPYLMLYVLECQLKIAQRVKRPEDRDVLLHDSRLTLAMAVQETEVQEMKQQLEAAQARIEQLLSGA